MPFAGDD